MPSLFKQHGSYYAQFYDSNRTPAQKRISLQTGKKPAAKRLFGRIVDAYALGEHTVRTRAMNPCVLVHSGGWLIAEDGSKKAGGGGQWTACQTEAPQTSKICCGVRARSMCSTRPGGKVGGVGGQLVENHRTPARSRRVGPLQKWGTAWPCGPWNGRCTCQELWRAHWESLCTYYPHESYMPPPERPDRLLHTQGLALGVSFF